MIRADVQDRSIWRPKNSVRLTICCPHPPLTPDSTENRHLIWEMSEQVYVPTSSTLVVTVSGISQAKVITDPRSRFDPLLLRRPHHQQRRCQAYEECHLYARTRRGCRMEAWVVFGFSG